jgi:hypothetical protein
MNRQSRFQPGKKPVYRLGRIGYATDAFLRVLGLADFSDGTSTSSRRIGRETQKALIPIRIPVGRRNRKG